MQSLKWGLKFVQVGVRYLHRHTRDKDSIVCGAVYEHMGKNVCYVTCNAIVHT